MGRWWPFGRAKAGQPPVESARELVEAPAPVVVEASSGDEVEPPTRFCEITVVKGVGEFHSLCELGLKHEPTGGVVIRTGHWVV